MLKPMATTMQARWHFSHPIVYQQLDTQCMPSERGQAEGCDTIPVAFIHDLQTVMGVCDRRAQQTNAFLVGAGCSVRSRLQKLGVECRIASIRRLTSCPFYEAAGRKSHKQGRWGSRKEVTQARTVGQQEETHRLTCEAKWIGPTLPDAES
jgi:hypothetical protein